MTYYRAFAWFQVIMGGLALFGSLDPLTVSGLLGGSIFFIGGLTSLTLLDKLDVSLKTR